MRTFPLIIALAFGALACGPKIGSTCEDVDDCRPIPAGYCAITGMCTAFCSSAGASCADEDGLCVTMATRSICLPVCEKSDECRSGETCAAVPGGTVCLVTDPLAMPDL
jgi:hypothetical protein